MLVARDRFIEDPEPADPLTTALVFFQLVVFLGCVLASKWFRGFLGWVRLGRPSRSDVGLTMAFVVVSSIALLVWRYTANPDLERYAAHAPDVPLYLIPPGLVALALLNATYEELVWRGVVMHGLHAACRSVWWALVLQAPWLWSLAFPRLS